MRDGLKKKLLEFGENYVVRLWIFGVLEVEEFCVTSTFAEIYEY